jgi:hypothetical protein
VGHVVLVMPGGERPAEPVAEDQRGKDHEHLCEQVPGHDASRPAKHDGELVD